MLLQSLYKPTDGLIARSIDRARLAGDHQAPACRTNITPNQMTLLATVVGAIGVLIVSRGGYWNVLAGTALFEGAGHPRRLRRRDRADQTSALARRRMVRPGRRRRVEHRAARGASAACSRPTAIATAVPLTRVSAASQFVFAIALYAGLVKTGGGGSVARLPLVGGRSRARR
jgi:hypothetical protein